MSDQSLIALSLAWPAIGALCAWWLGRWPNARDTASSIATLLTFGAVIVFAIWLIFGWTSKP